MQGGRLCFYRLVVSCFCVIVALSCGVNGEEVADNIQREVQVEEGNFEVTLRAVNPGLTEAMGLGKLIVSSEQLYVKLALKGLLPGVLSRQHMHLSGRCPDDLSDINGDGIVDEVEGFESYGEIVLSLNSNLNIHDYDTNTYPRSNRAGVYVYEERGKRAAIIEALSRDLQLDGRVIVVYGVPETVPLPPTARAYARGSVQASIPVACGLIRRKEMPVLIPERSRPVPRLPPEIVTPPHSESPTPSEGPPTRARLEEPPSPPPSERSRENPEDPPPETKPPSTEAEEEDSDADDDDGLEDLRDLLEDVVGGIGDGRRSNYGDEVPNRRRRY